MSERTRGSCLMWLVLQDQSCLMHAELWQSSCRYFVSLISACGVALLLLAPMVNLKNFVQREAARKAKLQ